MNTIASFLIILGACSLVAESRAHGDSGAPGVPEFVINPQSEANPWTHLSLNNRRDSFQFAIVTDNSGGMRPGVFADAVGKLNLLQPEFVMSVGDLINGYTEDEKLLVSEWEEFDSLVDRLEMPFFYVAGNHDYTNDVMARLWQKRYGPSYYHFVYRDVLFVMLNSNDGGRIHSMSERQVGWLQGVLEANPSPRWSLVFTHAPLWDMGDASLWPEVEALLEGRKYTVFAGHHHRYVKRERQGSKYFTLATTGGGSGLRGPRFGEFDHVMWVTMAEDGPILANLLLEGIWSEDIRDEELRDRQAAVVDGGKLALQPILYRSSLDKGTSDLRLTNDSDVPYEFEASFSQISNVALLTERTRSVTVPPNEVVTLPVEISAIGDLPSGDFEALEMEWSLRFLGKPEQEIFEGTEALAVIQEQPIPSAARIVSDGDLKDWRSIPFFSDDGRPWYHPENWKNEKDARFEWAMAVSDGHLHVAVNVTDEAIVRAPGKELWYQDGVYVQIDARPGAKRLRNRASPRYDSGAWVASLMPPSDSARQELLVKGAAPQGTPIAYAVVSKSGGYVAEISIPFAALDEAAKGAWDRVRINVLQIDYDPNENSRAIRRWQPAWSDSEALLGSGSFYRP